MPDDSNSRALSSITSKRLWSLIGNRLHHRRSQLGLSRSAVAIGLGVPLSSYEDLEGGLIRPSAAQIARLAEICEVPVSYFFQDVGFGRSGGSNPRVVPLAPASYAVATDADRVALLAGYFRRLEPQGQQLMLSIAKALAEDNQS